METSQYFNDLLEMAIAVPEYPLVENNIIFPFDLLTDHPPLAGSIHFYGTKINFISWNLMQAKKGFESQQVKFRDDVIPYIYASINFYLKNLMALGTLDFIFLQEAYNTDLNPYEDDIWYHISPDALDIDNKTSKGLSSSWKVAYDNIEPIRPKAKHGLVTYYNINSLREKGFHHEIKDFVRTSTTLRPIRSVLTLSTHPNKPELSLLNVHLMPPDKKQTQEIIVKTIDSLVKDNKSALLVGDHNLQHNNLEAITLNSKKKLMNDYLLSKDKSSIEIHTNEDNFMIKAVLLFMSNLNYGEYPLVSLEKYPITDKYGYSTHFNKRQVPLDRIPYRRMDQHQLVNMHNSEDFMNAIKKDIKRRLTLKHNVLSKAKYNFTQKGIHGRGNKKFKKSKRYPKKNKHTRKKK